jgi:hypothetical protein
LSLSVGYHDCSAPGKEECNGSIWCRKISLSEGHRSRSFSIAGVIVFGLKVMNKRGAAGCIYSAERRDFNSRYKVPVLFCDVVITISICGIFHATLVSYCIWVIPNNDEGDSVAIHRRLRSAERFNCIEEISGRRQYVARSRLCTNQSGSSSTDTTTPGFK